MRGVCIEAMLRRHEAKGAMGGPEEVIEIDESLIGKQKNHVGRVPTGTWIFGMYLRSTKELRLVRCHDNKRDSTTLIPYITQHIKKGSKIISDCWSVYYDNKNKVSHLTKLVDTNGDSYDYQHETVNHSENFVDPITGANTQTIECYWRHLKTKMRKGGISYKNKADHLYEFVYRHECKVAGIDVFEQFLLDIKDQFPVV
jgi:hypothetical protein